MKKKESNFGKKMKKNEKRGKLKNTSKKVKKKKWNALWITVVIHSAFGCGETMISLHVYRKFIWKNTAEIHSILKKKNYKVKFLTSSIFKK